MEEHLKLQPNIPAGWEPARFVFNPNPVTDHIEEEFEIANLLIWVHTENRSGLSFKNVNHYTPPHFGKGEYDSLKLVTAGFQSGMVMFVMNLPHCPVLLADGAATWIIVYINLH